MCLVADSLRVREDEDNCDVVQSARDALKLIRNKYLPAVCAWVQVSNCPSGPQVGVLGMGVPSLHCDTPPRGSCSPVQGCMAGT